jgi:hypothetical protein
MQMDKPPEKRLLTVEDFLAEYHIGRSKFYEEVRNKKLQITKLGKRTYVKRDNADIWLKNLGEKIT